MAGVTEFAVLTAITRQGVIVGWDGLREWSPEQLAAAKDRGVELKPDLHLEQIEDCIHGSGFVLEPNGVPGMWYAKVRTKSGEQDLWAATGEALHGSGYGRFTLGLFNGKPETTVSARRTIGDLKHRLHTPIAQLRAEAQARSRPVVAGPVRETAGLDDILGA